jgi:Raf kinase inhibitor-like YbhB/YbcL family protein
MRVPAEGVVNRDKEEQMKRLIGKSGLVCIGVLWLAACATIEPAAPPTAFRLGSPVLPDNALLAPKNGGNLKTNPNCLGDNVSPPLEWTNVPEKARSLVLLMDDQAGRAGLGVSHMVVYGIPPKVTSFAEGELSAPPKDGRFVAGKSTPGPTGYFGPCPPRGNAPQHYVFTLIATDLEPGALGPGLTKDEVLKALQGGRALRAAGSVFRFAQ